MPLLDLVPDGTLQYTHFPGDTVDTPASIYLFLYSFIRHSYHFVASPFCPGPIAKETVLSLISLQFAIPVNRVVTHVEGLHYFYFLTQSLIYKITDNVSEAV
jgi:hypothetical protein